VIVRASEQETAREREGAREREQEREREQREPGRAINGKGRGVEDGLVCVCLSVEYVL